MSDGDNGGSQPTKPVSHRSPGRVVADAYKRLGEYAGYTLAIVAVVAGLVAWGTGAFSRSSSRSISERLATLGPGLQLRAFSKELGAPEVERAIGKLKWVTYVRPAFYVTAIVEPDGTVGLFSVTARDARQPIRIDGITLCRTHLSEVPSPFTTDVVDWYWVEMHEQPPTSPNPGDIPQPYEYFAVNPAALACSDGARPLKRVQSGSTPLSGSFGNMDGLPPGGQRRVDRLRTQLVVNTYARASRQFSEYVDPYSVGSDTPKTQGVPEFYIGPNPEEVKFLGKR